MTIIRPPTKPCISLNIKNAEGTELLVHGIKIARITSSDFTIDFKAMLNEIYNYEVTRLIAQKNSDANTIFNLRSEQWYVFFMIINNCIPLGTHDEEYIEFDKRSPTYWDVLHLNRTTEINLSEDRPNTLFEYGYADDAFYEDILVVSDE